MRLFAQSVLKMECNQLNAHAFLVFVVSTYIWLLSNWSIQIQTHLSIPNDNLLRFQMLGLVSAPPAIPMS